MKRVRPPSELERQFLREHGVTDDMDVAIFQEMATAQPEAWAVIVNTDGNVSRQVITWKSLEKMRVPVKE